MRGLSRERSVVAATFNAIALDDDDVLAVAVSVDAAVLAPVALLYKTPELYENYKT
jgi:hypothetical protein